MFADFWCVSNMMLLRKHINLEFIVSYYNSYVFKHLVYINISFDLLVTNSVRVSVIVDSYFQANILYCI